MLAARADQFLRWEYRATAIVYATDAEEVHRLVTCPLAGEAVDLDLRWTGRWHVETVDPDTWVFIHGTEPPSDN
jgi:hypothetical protein